MKKIFFLAILFALFGTTSVFAGTTDTLCPCPQKEKVIQSTPVSYPVHKMKAPSGGISNSFNTTITIYPQAQYQPNQSGVPIVNNASSDDSFFKGFWALMALAAIVIGIIAFVRSGDRSITVDVRHHGIPPVTVPAPKVVFPPSNGEIEKAMADSKSAGATFNRSADGSYSIQYPKTEKQS